MNDRNENTAVKEIPYGIADYERIRTENYYYVDKTMFLQTVKKAGRYLFFIRPRRFGKSLFLSVMAGFYPRRCHGNDQLLSISRTDST